MIPPDHDWLDVLAAIATMLLGLGGMSALAAVLLNWNKSRSEKRQVNAGTGKIRAETADLWQQIADQAALKALKVEERVQELEKTLKEKLKIIEELTQANLIKDNKIASLEYELLGLKKKVADLEGKK